MFATVIALLSLFTMFAFPSSCSLLLLANHVRVQSMRDLRRRRTTTRLSQPRPSFTEHQSK